MKILSIDFDIIMGPSIEIYNHKMGSNCTCQQFEKFYPLIRYANADLMVYSILTDFLIDAAKDMRPDQIHFIMNHMDILNFINEDDKVTIMNIDHHHDLGYPGLGNESVNCGNWLDFLFEEKCCEGLTWIQNSTSSPPPPKYKTHPMIQEFEFPEIDLIYELIKPDMIVICGSFEWIPTQFQPLFYLWRDIISNIQQYQHEVMLHEPPTDR